MRKLLFILPLLALVACGEDANVDDSEGAVELKTFDDKMSYTFGALEAQKLTESTDPIAAKLDREMLAAGFRTGFKPGFSSNPDQQCNETLNNLFGAQGMDFNDKFLKEGSKCYGAGMAGMFYEKLQSVEEEGRINKELLYKGFEDELAGVADALTKEEKKAIVDQFTEEVNTKMMAKQEQAQANQASMYPEIEAKEAEAWAKVKAMSGLTELESGVYIETLRIGSGELPKRTDDVEVSYNLTDIFGTQIQNSDEFGKHFTTNLSSSLYPGWVIGLLAMKKGGKYRIYVPAPVADRQKSLIFEMEIFNIGPAGSIVQAQGY